MDVLEQPFFTTGWPVEVGAIDLTYDAADTLTEYTITLSYDYLNVSQSESPGGLGSVV